MPILDVGCGFLKHHKKRGTIGIDLNKGLCDVIADAENMPFRDRVFDEVLIFDVLEHLDNPLKCLKEGDRVAKNNARLLIKIPCQPKMFSIDVLMLGKLFLEFPFAIPEIISHYRLLEKHKHLKGYMHVNEITPKHISKFYKVLSIHRELEWSIRLIPFKRFLRQFTKKFLKEPQIGLFSWIVTAKKKRSQASFLCASDSPILSTATMPT